MGKTAHWNAMLCSWCGTSASCVFSVVDAEHAGYLLHISLRTIHWYLIHHKEGAIIDCYLELNTAWCSFYGVIRTIRYLLNPDQTWSAFTKKAIAKDWVIRFIMTQSLPFPVIICLDCSFSKPLAMAIRPPLFVIGVFLDRPWALHHRYNHFVVAFKYVMLQNVMSFHILLFVSINHMVLLTNNNSVSINFHFIFETLSLSLQILEEDGVGVGGKTTM